MKTRARRRPGGAALVALVCLSVIGLVVAGLLRVNRARTEQVRAIERRVQADWLVEAGLERAMIQYQADPSYSGESWSIPSEALGGRPATVVIAIDAVRDGAAGVWLVRVRADYPADGGPSARARRSKVFQVRPPAAIRERHS